VTLLAIAITIVGLAACFAAITWIVAWQKIALTRSSDWKAIQEEGMKTQMAMQQHGAEIELQMRQVEP
jgi:signal transduction histidine kinase